MLTKSSTPDSKTILTSLELCTGRAIRKISLLLASLIVSTPGIPYSQSTMFLDNVAIVSSRIRSRSTTAAIRILSATSSLWTPRGFPPAIMVQILYEPLILAHWPLPAFPHQMAYSTSRYLLLTSSAFSTIRKLHSAATQSCRILNRLHSRANTSSVQRPGTPKTFVGAGCYQMVLGVNHKQNRRPKR